MNTHDSQRMVALMAAEGYALTDQPDEADLIVLNSCSVREKAEQKLRSKAGEMKHIKRQRPEVVLAIGGCVAQQEGERMLKRIPQADIVFGPDHLSRLPDLVREVQTKQIRLEETEFLDRRSYRFPVAPAHAPAPISAYVSVMKGCDKFCSFCIVPYTRGREVSRPAAEILDEVHCLADQGTKEVILLGQTVNAYGKHRIPGQVPFHELLYKVAEVPGIERLRFTSPHPSEFSLEQIEAFREIPELCPHMHLPAQSGSSSVLQAMRRGYTREEYLEVVATLRRIAPQVALTTDLIVGFPGETEQEFQETMTLLEEVRFIGAYSFAYSERVGTRALKIEPSVPVEERMRRLHVLQRRQDEITEEVLQKAVGERQVVMIEGRSKTDASRSSGRNGENRSVHVEGHYGPGTFLDVKIVEGYRHSLLGCAL
ncbi:MAG: tRNA (N6-isopentenyl adenosine(37)-C2)-methylthiotransferase MiaB [Myxococcales bacterium]|nr:tRNA (N6-isopentenyl adenosine(37)-C2)-methylthiotransferase MiaB [Myxococcales bacterium]